MAKMRVHELAKELGMRNPELLSVLKNLGYEVTNHMSVVDETQIRKVRAYLGGGDPGRAEAVLEKRIDKPASTGKAVVIRRRAKAEEPAPVTEPAPVAPAIETQPEVSQADEASLASTVLASKSAPTQAPEPVAAPAVVPSEEEVTTRATPETVQPTFERARILDKPLVPASQLKSSAPPIPVREPTETAEEFEARRKKLKGRPQAEVIPRRRVVTKRQFQMQALMGEEDELVRSRRRKSERKRREQQKTEITTPKAIKRKIRISDAITVGDLAHHMGVKASEVLKKLLALGVMATVNQGIDSDTAAIIASDYGYEIENVAFQVEDVIQAQADEASEAESGVKRPPVVTVMGHVDHGKTSLLDAIRQTSVAAKEAGGITQHIGAYTVETPKGTITFIDTPGHEAFTALRARGAQVTDLVVLVVAANDGVMPQTIEAINHAKAAGVPMIVAVNKVDLPEANPDRVRQQLTEYGLVAEAWGGDTIFENVSAKKGIGIQSLLDSILLQAEFLELKANPAKRASGVVVESRLDKGRGPVATVLVKDGTLHVGDYVVAGTTYGRVRAMMDHAERQIKEAGPSTPVEVLGLNDVPAAGEKLNALKDERTAKQVAEHRLLKLRELEMARTSKVSLEDLYKQIQEGEVHELRLVIKADVQGSIEALRESFTRLSTDEVKVRIIHTGVGAVTESDVMLASASNAVIICFNVRPDGKSSSLAEREGVEIKSYSIIYEAVDDVRKAMEGLLAPEFKEVVVGRADVRQTFNIAKAGTVAGCMVVDGKIQRTSKVRVLRDGAVVYTGRLASLRRIKDDVREVVAGFECGMAIENFNDVKPGDVIEAFEVEQVSRTLRPTPAVAR